jgi:histidyl-tRNA synthetase
LYRAPRGTFDILPQDHIYWKYVEEKASSICQIYGFQPLSTPIFEDAQIFVKTVAGGTDIVDKEMYIFEDKSGQKLALRAEVTAPVCRAYLEHGLFNSVQPVKLYYIGPAFRYERPQSGRYRQHHQFGFEALGEADPALDAEVIEMAQQFFYSLGLSQLTIKLNSIGCRVCRPGYLEVLKQHYSDYTDRLCADCKVRLSKNPLRLLDCKKKSCQEIARTAPKITDYLCQECRLHFESVQKYLKAMGIPCQLNHRLVRGLDYYTRTVFEVEPRNRGGQSTLGGGGRYDDLIQELGGPPTPAVGFATGLERIILNLKEEKTEIAESPKPAAFIAHLGEEAKVEAMKIASALRKDGISIITATGDKSLRGQMRQANSLGVARALILGEQELSNQNVVLRDMKSGEQRTISVREIVGTIKHGQK